MQDSPGVRWGARSWFPLHWLLKTQFAACRDDGQVIVHVVADEVTDALKAVVLRPNLRREGGRGTSAYKSSQAQGYLGPEDNAVFRKSEQRQNDRGGA